MDTQRNSRSSASSTSASSLADRAFDWIVNAIVRSEIAPGERLKEARIARQLAISRGTLREAMNRLEGRKIVERKRHLGVQDRGLLRRDLDELFTAREALEGMACRFAATSISAPDFLLADFLPLRQKMCRTIFCPGTPIEEYFRGVRPRVW